MNWESIICIFVVIVAVICIAYNLKKGRQFSAFYTELKKKNTTELDLELATSDQLIKALVKRPGYPLILITPKDQKHLEVHVRNVTPIGVCNLLATAQLVVLNQDYLEKQTNEEEDYE